jgi:cobalt-zinc-cadmium efflux system membrane fusion protein
MRAFSIKVLAVALLVLATVLGLNTMNGAPIQAATETTAQEQRDPDRLWCKEHDVYEDECFLCHPEMKPDPDSLDPDRLFCKEHGVYEDQCFLCHPELKGKIKPKKKAADAEPARCKEHGVYEGQCFLCDPALMPDPKKLDPDRLFCKEHGVYEDQCFLCHPELKDKKPKKAATPAEPARCKEHGVYEDECFLCHPEIKPSTDDLDPDRLFCKEHGVYEDKCFLCHPELKDKKRKPKADGKEKGAADKDKVSADERDPDRLWCKEHGLYEDECLLCHPELKDKESAGGGSASNALFCKEHSVPEIECGICHPDRLADLDVGEGMKVRFATKASPGKAGVVMGTPVASGGGAAQELLGQVAFNGNSLALVTPLGGGVVMEVRKDVGEEVEVGEILATVQSPDLATVRSEYRRVLAEARLAQQTLAREQDLHRREISARQDLEQAQAAAAVADAAASESRQHLLNLGLSSKEIESGGDFVSALPVRAPFSGTIIQRSAVQGTAVQPGDALFTVVDLSSMWMQLSVPESQLSAMQVGSLVQARFEAYPGISFEGEISWVSPTIETKTRMLQARAVLANPQGLLKEGLFGRASLAGLAERAGLTVPAGAVQDIDGKVVVFRKLEADLFETRLVETGLAHDGSIAVLAGLAPGDEIVTEGSYVMKSELLKSRMGAGCTDH